MKKRTFLAGAASAIGVSAFGTVSAMAQDKKVKVGFIYVGPVNDGGWSQHHHESALAMVKALGEDKVELVEQDNVPEGPDAERAMTQMALNGCDIIFATSFGYMDPAMNVAKKFPKVKFEHATGYKTADNMACYSARFYEGRAIEGTIAGRMTTTNKIGYIAAVPIPEVVRGINSSYIHAKKVNPDVEFSVIWLFTWLDPAKEADAARTLIEQGCDVILQHTDSTAPLAAAQAAGNVIGFGQAGDMIEYAPKPRVASIIDNWAPYYEERVKAVADGSWETHNVWEGLSTGMVKIGEITDAVPAEVKKEAEDMIAAISSGAYHPFTGPLNKQDGSVWLKEGEVADDGTLAGMTFYVEGLKGDVPS
ncbi:BMP family ABC transporter substrate-binding protein [Pseudooceanicola sp. CBS1P-1]|uniref:BMP family ABC transporter substrate-binding protein n=1 Tax=Pseudooceanicola albus TaxID=2692189 RepID=A0A6L7GAN5_9RHOB|nr:MULTISPECIES: BMP family ABC transporter substrate-binding protein [Pseudooceanicola]MBT9386914.1 BMP family ABC transporter substrate-binding protein [Pseudooceanicola endophyticus]MXN21019.1 BMP family ABC transporter substrate-binding protein [Pseudooceanicola albus]